MLIISIKDRAKLKDTTGDPWDGRMLEWSTPSPMPFYNYAVLPVVSTRDPFWEQKHPSKKTVIHEVDNRPKQYKDIVLPKNSAMGMLIAGFAFLFAFSMVWHILWLGIVGLLGVIISVIIRSTNEKTEYTIPAAKIAVMDKSLSEGQA